MGFTIDPDGAVTVAAGPWATLAAARFEQATGATPGLLAAIDRVLASAGAGSDPAPGAGPSRGVAPAAAAPDGAVAADAADAGLPARRRRSPRPKPYKAVRYRRGGDPTRDVDWVYGADATEEQARRYLRRMHGIFTRAHSLDECAQWSWTVVHDPDGRLVNPAPQRSPGD
jgi:hypothetical protein